MANPALAPKPQTAIRVLLVEDNLSDAFFVGNLLEELNQTDYQTCHVKTKADALRQLADHCFDVCLLDLTLPDANGFSGLIHIQEKAPDMPVLILTGLNDTALARKAVGRGAQDYLLKNELETAGLSRSIDYAIERKRIEKNLFERANHDGMTGLANRVMFENCLSMALARAERNGGKVAVLFIDLDRFKPINDNYGHDAGDEALKIISERLKKTLRPYDIPARFGGDEFAVLLEGIANPRDAANIAHKIITSISIPVPFRGNAIEIGASIGIAFYDTPISQAELLQHADVAMYYAKRDGGNTHRFYSSEMNALAEERLQMEEDLHVAITSRELRLYYQPYMIAGHETILGVEVLLRWLHPEKGLLCPEAFLNAAETAKMMCQISQWLSLQLRRDIAMWSAQMLQPIQIAINLSASQLDDPDLFKWLTPLAQKEFLGENRLAVELPEEVLASMTAAQKKTLLSVHQLGIGLHLNGYGRNSLPLQALLSLPFSMLKIDLALIQGIVDQLEGNMLVDAAIMLAHYVGLKVAAVGVEIPWQMKVLAAGKCDIMQGFLIAHPMTAEQLLAWAAERQQT